MRLTGLRLVVVALSAVGLITTSAALELFGFGERSAALNASIDAATARQDALFRLSQAVTAVAVSATPETRSGLAAALGDPSIAPLLDAAALPDATDAAALGTISDKVAALASDEARRLDTQIALWNKASASLSQMLSLSLASIVVLLFTVVLRTLGYLSARDRTEAVLRRAMAEAEAANAAKSDFLATMSHEIRTPLTAIRGYSDLLAKGALTDVQRDQLDRVRDANAALARLIDDILDLSKIEAGHFDLDLAAFDLPALIDRVLGMVTPTATAKGLSVDCTIAADVPRHILGDSFRLMQVLLNLTNNAVKFTQTGGITVTVDRAGDRLRLAVSDTGIGIAAADVAKLFKRFSQIDSSLSRAHAGTGLGLAISRALVARMGGEIAVQSAPEAGTTFTVTLPLSVATPVDETAQTPPPRVAGQGARILVVEDSAQNQDLIQAVLRRDGHTCTAAFDGAEGVAAARAGSYDLVIMDVQMPRMDGIAATAAIRALAGPQGRVPILAVSANAHGHQVLAMSEAGADGHLAKPFGIDDLARSVAGLLKRPPAPPAVATDFAELDALVALMGRDWVRTRLTEVLGGLDWTQAALGAPELRKRAHRLVSEAGQLGLTDLSAAASRVELAVDAGGDAMAERQALAKLALRCVESLPALTGYLDSATARQG